MLSTLFGMFPFLKKLFADAAYAHAAANAAEREWQKNRLIELLEGLNK